jgi:hypothetical protein
MPYIISLVVLWLYLIAGYFNVVHKALTGQETKVAEKVLIAEPSLQNSPQTLNSKTFISDFWGKDNNEGKDNKTTAKATSCFQNNYSIDILLICNDWNCFFHQAYFIDNAILAFYNKAPPERIV